MERCGRCSGDHSCYCKYWKDMVNKWSDVISIGWSNSRHALLRSLSIQRYSEYFSYKLRRVRVPCIWVNECFWHPFNYALLGLAFRYIVKSRNELCHCRRCEILACRFTMLCCRFTSASLFYDVDRLLRTKLSEGWGISLFRGLCRFHGVLTAAYWVLQLIHNGRQSFNVSTEIFHIREIWLHNYSNASGMLLSPNVYRPLENFELQQGLIHKIECISFRQHTKTNLAINIKCCARHIRYRAVTRLRICACILLL